MCWSLIVEPHSFSSFESSAELRLFTIITAARHHHHPRDWVRVSWKSDSAVRGPLAGDMESPSRESSHSVRETGIRGVTAVNMCCCNLPSLRISPVVIKIFIVARNDGWGNYTTKHSVTSEESALCSSDFGGNCTFLCLVYDEIKIFLFNWKSSVPAKIKIVKK